MLESFGKVCEIVLKSEVAKKENEMIKRIKEKLSELDYVELWCDYIRPAVLGLAGAMIGIAICIAAGLL